MQKDTGDCAADAQRTGPYAQKGPTLDSMLFHSCLEIHDVWMRGPDVFILHQALQTTQPVLPGRNEESSSLLFLIVVETADELKTQRESVRPSSFLVALSWLSSLGPLAQKSPSRST